MKYLFRADGIWWRFFAGCIQNRLAIRKNHIKSTKIRFQIQFRIQSEILQNGTAVNDFLFRILVIDDCFVVGIPKKFSGAISCAQQQISIIFWFDQWIALVHFSRCCERPLDISIFFFKLESMKRYFL